MGKRLNSLLGTLILVPSILAGCAAHYHPRIIEKRENVPVYNETPEGWQKFYNKIDERETTKGELTYIREYRGLRKEQKENYTKWMDEALHLEPMHLGPMLPESPEVEARNRKGKLTNKDLIFSYNLFKEVGEFVAAKVHSSGR